MKPITYELPLVRAKQAFASVLPHISGDYVTPVITCANFDGNSIIATDRYTVARYTLGAEAGEPIMLPRQLVAWVARVNLRALLNYFNPVSYSLTIEALPSSNDSWNASGEEYERRPIRAAVVSEMYGEERVMLFEHYRGNFPPVHRLINDFEAAAEAYPVALAPRMVERVTRYADQYHREQPVKWELGKATGSGKPSPIRATIEDFTALIQPSLILK